MLYGYGGFNNALTPTYTPSMLAWVEAGGVWAVANLRGGSEDGEEWHRAGMRERKQNVFDDFTAAAELAGRDRLDHAGQLGIYGGSNGGLLVGAALTQRPDLYAAVVCSAPLLDMVRYELFGLGRTWNDEYGTADDPEELGWLLSYSPYHRVVDGVDYPAVLFTTFDSDTRVDPLHARKIVRGAAARHCRDAAGAAAPGAGRRSWRALGQPDRATGGGPACLPRRPPGAVAVIENLLSEVASESRTFRDFLEEHREVLLVKPLRILIIILLALVTRWLVHRAITRAVRSTTDSDVPVVLKPLKERLSPGVLETTGLVSERRRQRAETVGSLLRSVASLVIGVLASMLVLGEIGFQLGPFIAGAGIVGIALGFGAQNLVKDFLSGIFMILEDQYGVGDVVDLGEVTGTVEAIGLRVSRLRGRQWNRLVRPQRRGAPRRQPQPGFRPGHRRPAGPVRRGPLRGRRDDEGRGRRAGGRAGLGGGRARGAAAARRGAHRREGGAAGDREGPPGRPVAAGPRAPAPDRRAA